MVHTDFHGLYRWLLAAGMVLLATMTTSEATDAFLCNEIRTIHSSSSSHSGYITSPNHPKAYPAENMQCTFKFIPKDNEQVQLTFSYFNLRESQKVPANMNCDLSDSVKVFIGTSRFNLDPGNQVGEYCGKRHPEIVMAVGRPLTVIFTVRAKDIPSISAVYMFKAKYTFTQDFGIKTHAHHNKTAGCHFIFDGRRTNAGKGDFDSPNFGGLYPFATNCLYTFKAFGNQSIRLNFDKFEVEGHHDCRRTEDDFLYIKEGNNVNWPNFYTSAEEDPVKRDPNSTLFCGLRSPPVFQTNNQVVNVIFKSGQWRTKHGFKGTYTFIGHPGVYVSRGSTTKSSNWSEILVTLLSLCLLTSARQIFT